MMKLLLALLMLCLLPCAGAEEASVHILDLSDMTLLTQSSEDVSADFLRLCPEADADTVRCITPEYTFLQYGLSSTAVYATPDGTAWVMKGESVFRMTDPGCRVTSIHPVSLRFISHWQVDKGLLYTQQRDDETAVRCLDLQTGEITPLLTAEGSLVIVAPSLHLTNSGYTPLPGYSDLLLCTAQITQMETSDPALTYAVETVVGDVIYDSDTYTDGVYKAALHPDGHAIVEYDGERVASLEAFAAVYRGMYPDHDLSDPVGSICERTYLTGNPAYGRLYEVTFNNMVFLWKDGQAHLINDSIGTSYAIFTIEEAILTDLNSDGTEELVCVFGSGSGMYRNIAAFYDPVSRAGRELYTSLLDSDADVLHLQMEDGTCQLYKGDTLLGTVMQHGLDTDGFNLTNLLDMLGF
ncbi:MAG: hypothetical protein IJZ74_08370 [Clostridia bacterium]|nr:hypothetical protein [Clostridia bacterium]